MLKLFKIEGNSLHPLVKDGEVVLCFKLFFFNTIKTNDIVLFNHKTLGFMIKQVVAVNRNSYFLKGTDAFSVDSRNFGEVQKKELLYRVLFKNT